MRFPVKITSSCIWVAIPVDRVIIFGIQLVNLITVCSDRRDIVECADKGMKVFDTGQFDFS